ncbi:hypothetical protein MUP77_04935 [Candidatus Bathyarchaeota archaeon]|nr:hypothetical protein [Candidatus Bathyarchaeota archaeon]
MGSDLGNLPFDKIKSQTRLVEKIGLVIPGYRGYKLRELRREADKLVRRYMYRELTLTRDDLRVTFQRLVDNKVTEAYQEIDRLDAISSQINYASYGYAGFFDSVKVNEDALDRMTDYDMKLVDNVKSLSEEIKKLKDDVYNGYFGNVMNNIKNIRGMVDSADNLMNNRKNVISGVM